ncbi:hypothetical protein CPB85DRAFT_1440694 [Mucidula mucida]|nr:hypothetical protein CPB85DRAFT_1440694 [Mucidula mucida]
MVILYGHMSKSDTLPRHTALEDVWLALDMLPRFRWRWERKDVNGGHPLISKLAERSAVDAYALGSVVRVCVWVSIRGMNGDSHNGHGSTPPGKHAPMPDCGHMFYPFYPEAQINGHDGSSAENGHYSHLLAAAAVPPSQDSYMSEERDGAVQQENHQSQQSVWMPPPPHPPTSMAAVRY